MPRPRLGLAARVRIIPDFLDSLLGRRATEHVKPVESQHPIALGVPWPFRLDWARNQPDTVTRFI